LAANPEILLVVVLVIEKLKIEDEQKNEDDYD
jgi:hypothetical protein